jgi:hypothetical protein
MNYCDVIAGRRVLRLTCAAQTWFGYPARPMMPAGLLIWNAPPGSIVRPKLLGQALAGSDAGLPLELFDPSQPSCEWLNKLTDWPTIDTANGIELTLRSPFGGELITAESHPEVRCVVYGVQFLP